MRAALAFLLALGTAPAFAEPIVFIAHDTRVPLHTASPWAPKVLRLYGEAWIAPTTDIVDALVLRVGPFWEPSDLLLVGLQGIVGLNDDPATQAANELRGDLEVVLRWKGQSLQLADRTRAELRFIDESLSYRARNQLKVNWQPEGATWIPFASNEVFFDLSKGAFNQNRAAAGVGWAFHPATRLDVGFMLRSRLSSGRWAHDQVFTFALSYAPKA